MVEVCYRPYHREVHGTKIAYQVLQLLLSDAVLRGWDGENLGQILKFSIGEGYRYGFCVNC